MMKAAKVYDTKGLEAAKAYGDALQSTFGAYIDGLKFFQAVSTDDFKLKPGSLKGFEQSVATTLAMTGRLATQAAKTPGAQLDALQANVAAISATAEAMIKLAAVPFGDIGAGAAGFRQQAGTLLNLASGLGGGGGTTIQNTFVLPAGSNQQTAQEVLRILNAQLQSRR
jgi:hypothetical protein